MAKCPVPTRTRVRAVRTPLSTGDIRSAHTIDEVDPDAPRAQDMHSALDVDPGSLRRRNAGSTAERLNVVWQGQIRYKNIMRTMSCHHGA